MGTEKDTVVLEYDSNGVLLGSYSRGPAGSRNRSQVEEPTTTLSQRALRRAIDVFLPSGYPHSVTSDYTDYQIYDSFQAFASTIANLLANRAVLAAVGVGDADATSTSALFMKIIQDAVGRCATILFAWKYGAALEPECKMYRFAADLANDTAIIFDTASPWFPQSVRVWILCVSGLFRSVCGVMGVSSRAALTLHFTDSSKGSISDVNAKDSSQETVITLLGMLAGSLVVSNIQSNQATWICMIVLLVFHLYTNYRAVKAVVMTSFNRQRTTLAVEALADQTAQHFLRSNLDPTAVIDAVRAVSEDLQGLIPSPSYVSKRELVLARGSAISRDGRPIATAKFTSIKDVLDILPPEVTLKDLMAQQKHWGYLIWCSFDTEMDIRIALFANDEQGSSADSLRDFRAWTHACLLARIAHTAQPNLITLTGDFVWQLGDRLREALLSNGWVIDRTFLDAHNAPRIQISHSD
ncbi:hypothetical protein CANCADRAFT_44126 [Tortispora caseinolytica NRRL Y-17796]|uniref:Protein root UVB sensitive/RUS domain-containing protein n=1 Tax=Tortispora caseinolytica NRRL Y-17796 TaxID=767744 RepID=A0A1E4TFB9_9ASCO|nr:hypothetical protein CANCADRAFT_44126 [Tortispora caseinolytica NRRL Y-17796]